MNSFKIFQSYNNLVADYSSKLDGNMDVRFSPCEEVRLNRSKFLEKIAVKEDWIVQAKLVHGEKIIEVTEEHLKNNEREFECDALVTKFKDIYLSFRTADCLPIYYFDPIKNVVALAHCGWQSTDKHLAEKVVKKIVDDFGCEVKNILVAMGPAIHKKSYKFEGPITKDYPSWSDYLEDLPSGETMIDNVQYNIDQLVQAGIKHENIESSKIDTGESLEYFSHYRSKRSGETDGRFINIIGLKD